MFKKLKYFFAGIQVCKLPGMLSSLDFIEPDFRSVMDKIMGLPKSALRILFCNPSTSRKKTKCKKRGWPFGHPQMLFGDYDVVEVVAMLSACFEVALKTFLTANLDNSGSIHILNDKT